MTIPLLQQFLTSMSKSLDLLEELDPDCERSGLKRRKIQDEIFFYEDLLKKRRRNAMQSILGRFLKKKASTTSDEPITVDEPQPGTSTGSFTIPPFSSRVSSSPPSPPLPSLLPSSSSSSDVDDPAPL